MSLAEASASRRNLANWRRAAYFGLWGGGGGLVGELLSEFVGLGGHRATFAVMIVEVGLWFGMIGALIGVAILLGSLTYSAGSFSAALNGSNLPRLALGAILGGLSGFIAGGVAQGFYTGIGPTEVLRVICWGIAGGLLGLGLSFRIPNLTSMRGFAGGFAGGAAGGVVFIGIGMVGGDIFGRLFGIPIIGFAIGLMIMLADALFRKAWIEIRYGPRETRTLTLGNEPLRIGSDAAHCQIYVKDVPAMACAYRFEQGRVVCDDRINNRNGPIAFGTPMTIGRIIVTPFGAEAQEPAGAPSSALPGTARAGQSYQSVLSLKNGRDLTLTEGTRLTAKDIPGLEASDRNGWVAEVLRNPENPAIVGLKNLSRRPWSATFANGRQVEIEPGRSLRLEDGARINFGAIEGRIGSGNTANPLSRMSASLFKKSSGNSANWFFRRWLVVAGIGAVLVVASVVMISRNLLQNQNPEAHAEEIKLENSGNTYQLKATINDTVKINFTLDTGASDVLIPAEVALTLLSSGTLSQSDFIGYQTYTLADGSTLPSAQFTLREMEVGSRRLTNVVASLGPVGSPPLLGQSFLSRLGSWTIDYHRQILVVQR